MKENIKESTIMLKSISLCSLDFTLQTEQFELDLKNRSLKGTVTFDEFKSLFSINSPLHIYKLKPQEIIFKDSDSIEYYCHNCIFHISFNDLSKISIHAYSIDYILENSNLNIESLKVNKYEIRFILPKSIMSNYIESLIEFSFTQSINVKITKIYEKKLTKLILEVSSKNMVTTKKLDELAFNIYELLMIYFGVGLEIENRTYYLEIKKMNFYYDIVDKYGSGVKNQVSTSNIIMVDSKSLNKEVIKKHLEFKKKTLLLNDMYLTIINTDTYKEIKINLILQCIEGFYKSIIDPTVEFWQILENVFLNNKYYSHLLSTSDKRKITVANRKEAIFLYKAKNHRNYFSHLNINERKEVFEKMQLNYAYWKIVIAYRLLVLDYLNLKYELYLLNRMVEDINNFKKSYKIKLTI